MKLPQTLLSFSALLFLLVIAPDCLAQNTKQTPIANTGAKIEVLQFHSEHRCATCNKIEAFTKETLKAYRNIPFSLVNVDDKRNERKAELFEATGTALFLYNPQTGKKKELTDFAFMHAGAKEKFIEGLKKEIDSFVKF